MKHKRYKKFYFKQSHLWFRNLVARIPDSIYLSLLYVWQTGKILRLRKPVDYNEKLQYLKLHDHDPQMVKLVDKYKVRQWVAKKIGKEFLIPLIGVWSSPSEIDYSQFPSKFVLKCTHDSGSVIVCHDKRNFDAHEATKALEEHCRNNYYFYSREWPYKHIKPMIIAEELLCDYQTNGLLDYKFFCFEGKPRLLMVVADRFGSPKSAVYDMDFCPLNICLGNPPLSSGVDKPKNFDTMVKIVQDLSMGYKHVRVDLYNIQGRIYFGEMTFYHWGGFAKITPKEWAKKMGDWIDLS